MAASSPRMRRLLRSGNRIEALPSLACSLPQFVRAKKISRLSPGASAAPLVTMEISVMEGVWAPIAEADDWQPFYKMLAQIRAHGTTLKQP